MTETDKITLMDEGGSFMARLWKKISAPVSYSRVFNVDGVNVKVSVEYGTGALKEAAKPKERRRVGEGNERLGYD